MPPERAERNSFLLPLPAGSALHRIGRDPCWSAVFPAALTCDGVSPFPERARLSAVKVIFGATQRESVLKIFFMRRNVPGIMVDNNSGMLSIFHPELVPAGKLCAACRC